MRGRSSQEMGHSCGNVQAAHHPWVFHTTQVCSPDCDVDHEKDDRSEAAKPLSARVDNRRNLVINSTPFYICENHVAQLLGTMDGGPRTGVPFRGWLGLDRKPALVCDDPVKTPARTEIQPSAKRALVRSISELWLTSRSNQTGIGLGGLGGLHHGMGLKSLWIN